MKWLRFFILPCFLWWGNSVSFSIDFLSADREAAVYRTGTPDPVIATLPKSAAENLSLRDEAGLERFVNILLKNASDDFTKVKRIHDWITDNIAYDNDSFFGGEKTGDFLKERRATCGGFAAIFSAMATRAGIKVRTIAGKSRVTVDSKTETMARHIWNAVEIAGKWYLVDATHDSRFAFENGKFGKKSEYRDTQLFIAPEGKIIDNLPLHAEDQLLSNPITEKEFLERPLFQLRMVRLGIKAQTIEPSPEKIRAPMKQSRYQAIKEQVALNRQKALFRFQVPAEVSLFAGLKQGEKAVEGHALCHRNGEFVDSEFSSPGKGMYSAWISARHRPSEKLYLRMYEFSLAGSGSGPSLPEKGRMVLFDPLSEYGVKIIASNFSDNTKPLFLELEHPATTSVFSALWDAQDRKIADSASASSPETVAGGFRIRYTFKPQSTDTVMKLRVKRSGEKLFNETALLAGIPGK